VHHPKLSNSHILTCESTEVEDQEIRVEKPEELEEHYSNAPKINPKTKQLRNCCRNDTAAAQRQSEGMKEGRQKREGPDLRRKT
jgi:hypothetical protein